MERVMGIEPTFLAWEANVLPLNYTRLSHGNSNDFYATVNQHRQKLLYPNKVVIYFVIAKLV
jgi:hypothetical protein